MATIVQYNLFLSDGTLDSEIFEGTVSDSHGLRFTGFQKADYGENRNNNLIHILENFANATPPTADPLLGQFWWDTSVVTPKKLKVWNGTIWAALNNDIVTEVGPFTVDGAGQVALMKNQGPDIIIDNIGSEAVFDAHETEVTGAHTATAITFGTTFVEVTDVDFTGHTIVGGDYWTLSSPSTNYYVWYTVDAGGADPAPGGTGLQVDILGADTDADVATKTRAVVNAAADFFASGGAEVVTVSNVIVGNVPDAADFNAGVSINVLQQGVAAQIQAAIDEIQTTFISHLVTDGHAGTAISFVPFGSISSINVQDAIDELDAELDIEEADIAQLQIDIDNHINDLVDAHDASAVSYNNPLLFPGLPVTVQSAIEELDTAVTSVTKSVVDSFRATRAGAHPLIGSSPTKLLFNVVNFGNDLCQFDPTVGATQGSYIAGFDQQVRVRAYCSLINVPPGGNLILYIRKNGSNERVHKEDTFADSNSITISCEASCLMELTAGDEIEIFAEQPTGNVSLTTASSRTAFEIDVLKATGPIVSSCP